MLANNRIDVAIVGENNARYLLKILGIKLDFQMLEIADVPPADLFLCFSKTYKEADRLRENFNRGLAIVKENGTFDAIYARYR